MEASLVVPAAVQDLSVLSVGFQLWGVLSVVPMAVALALWEPLQVL